MSADTDAALAAQALEAIGTYTHIANKTYRVVAYSNQLRFFDRSARGGDDVIVTVGRHMDGRIITRGSGFAGCERPLDLNPFVALVHSVLS